MSSAPWGPSPREVNELSFLCPDPGCETRRVSAKRLHMELSMFHIIFLRDDRDVFSGSSHSIRSRGPEGFDRIMIEEPEGSSFLEADRPTGP